MLVLNHSCDKLPGVGPNLAAKLAKCGIHTIQDLLFHLPFRYQDRTRITPIQDLRAQDWCVISGKVCKTQIKYGKRRMLYCYVEDKTGVIQLRFFHFNQQQIKRLNESFQIRVFGEVREFAQQLEMIHPEYQIMAEGETCSVEETLTPIYPTTQGLTQTRLRQLVKKALQEYQKTLQELEWMTDAQRKMHHFQSIDQALSCLHYPPPDIPLQALEEGHYPAMKRVVFDELLAHRLSMQFARAKRSKYTAPCLQPQTHLRQSFLKQLPFTLTNAQQRVSQEIANDLQKNKPMLRLVQGDVGAGKTVIAALAAIQAIANGYQVAFMAPTDLLSEQHAQNMTAWLKPLGLSVARLSGKMKAKERAITQDALKKHECHIVVGTHALFQNTVSFAKLGLIIIDEQHRFGVEQRLSLQQKGHQDQTIPHQLLMTATPIPRTLAMAQFAHIDLSTLDELPPGRIPITTAVLAQEKRQHIIERLRSALADGRQVYWVCTLIEDSEKLQCMAATESAQSLREQLPEFKIGLIHGRMKSTEKDDTMMAFKQGSIDILVATTVIEVGVDVPNASLMIIENAERLGLSQLHQLRGRVGRGTKQAHCILLYQQPISQIGRERMQTMRQTNDGFVIAEKDLQLRGAGEMLGTRQTGYRHYKIADLNRDRALLSLLPQFADELMRHDPTTAKAMTTRWLGEFESFFQVG